MKSNSPFSPMKVARFWAKVNVTSDVDSCWEWTGSLNNTGYGLFGDGKAAHNILAHRFSMALCLWRILPPEELVLHTCDNPKCVNPSHLYVGTHADNTADRNSKMRHNYGERNGNNKLVDTDIVEIREMLDSGLTTRAIAALFGVAPSTIWMIGTRKIWRHVK